MKVEAVGNAVKLTVDAESRTQCWNVHFEQNRSDALGAQLLRDAIQAQLLRMEQDVRVAFAIEIEGRAKGKNKRWLERLTAKVLKKYDA